MEPRPPSATAGQPARPSAENDGRSDRYTTQPATRNIEANGDTKATYGYTAYGQNDNAETTGIDKPDPADPTKEPYNAYRYEAKRWDPNSGTYDMGFRDYDPGLNRFLGRDTYNGALDDQDLATDPFSGNRYAFGGGNPVGTVELDGHRPVCADGPGYAYACGTPQADRLASDGKTQTKIGRTTITAPTGADLREAINKAFVGIQGANKVFSHCENRDDSECSASKGFVMDILQMENCPQAL